VQDVTADSPAARAGVLPYDVIVAIDDRPVGNDDELIGMISSRPPGTNARLTVLRSGREESVIVKLAERPGASARAEAEPTAPVERTPFGPGLLGLTVRDLDAGAFNRLKLPSATRGVLITRVEAMSPAFDADLQRSMVLLEINRKAVESVQDYRRIASAARSGDILALYVYAPDIRQRKLLTVRVDDR
jgi:serine protease Do